MRDRDLEVILIFSIVLSLFSTMLSLSLYLNFVAMDVPVSPSFRQSQQIAQLQAELRDVKDRATQSSERVALLVVREEYLLDLLVAANRSGWWSREARRKLSRLAKYNQQPSEGEKAW